MLKERICPGCMRRKAQGEDTCSVCGFTASSYAAPKHHLPPGTVLAGKYLIGRSVGEGGFGITYIAMDIRLETVLAVKELFPRQICSREEDLRVSCGMKDRDLMEQLRAGFLREARVLAMLDGQDVQGTVTVRDHFEENRTAYIVMEYLCGMTLQEYVKKNGPLTWNRTMDLLSPVLSALVKIQQFGLVHRDVSPENIMVLPDGRAVLMDFGAAALPGQVWPEAYKKGYAPPEQCRAGGRTGPWTDVYSFAATVCFCLSAIKPEDSLDRAEGEAPGPAAGLRGKMSGREYAVLCKALETDPARRWASAEELACALPARMPAGGRIAGPLCALLAAAGIMAFFFLSISSGGGSVPENSFAGEQAGTTGETAAPGGQNAPADGQPAPEAGSLITGLSGDWHIAWAGEETMNWCVSREEEKIIVWEDVWDSYAVFTLAPAGEDGALYRLIPKAGPDRCVVLDPESGLIGLGEPGGDPWQLFRIRSCGDDTVIIHGHDETAAGLEAGADSEGSLVRFAPYDTFTEEGAARWRLLRAREGDY